MEKKSLSLIGYAYGAAAGTPGANEAPRVLRSLKLVERIERLGHSVADLGDAAQEVDPVQEKAIDARASESERKTNNLALTYLACSRLAEKTKLALDNKTMPLIIGGDHSLSIGSVAAVSNHYRKTANKEIGLLWIDTHTDINTPETSASQNIYGMSVACLLGMIPGVLASLQERTPAVRFENMAYIGVRDLDPGEKTYVREKNILAFTIKEVDVLGMAEVTRRAVEHVTRNTAGYVASFDLDVCDSYLVPGTGLPIRGGLTYREAHLLMELLADDGRMLAFEMVELNPRLDKDFATADFAVSLIESALGRAIL